MLNNREVASVAWLLVALVLGLRVPRIRQSLAVVVRALIQPAILVVIVAFSL
jgi:hypothetical protein